MKEMKQHYEVNVAKTKTMDFSEEGKIRMAHGTEHEIHAAATFACRVMPFLCDREDVFVEEGARFIASETNQSFIEVSSDGTIRKQLSETGVSSACEKIIEIKCPYPQENKCPVQYTLPQYYVCQLLCEMKAANVTSGYFASYSKESTAVHLVTFDEELWTVIYSEAKSLYGMDPSVCPKKMPLEKAALGARLKSFTQNNVELVMEIPSVTAVVQDHSPIEDTNSPYVWPGRTENVLPHERPGIVMDLVTYLQQGKQAIYDVHQVCRRRATEILGFLLSDTDRVWNPEAPHHIPVAYALKGYSLPVQNARRMVDKVLQELYEQKVRVACTSFDGQFIQMVVRGLDDKPHTVMQLQKDVWKDSVRTQKAQIVTTISNLYKVCKLSNSMVLLLRSKNSDSVNSVYSIMFKWYKAHNFA